MYLTVGNAVNPHSKEKREMPWEYVQLRLCRDVYHCTPSALDEEDWATVQTHLRLLDVEARAKEMMKN